MNKNYSFTQAEKKEIIQKMLNWRVGKKPYKYMAQKLGINQATLIELRKESKDPRLAINETYSRATKETWQKKKAPMKWYKDKLKPVKKTPPQRDVIADRLSIIIFELAVIAGILYVIAIGA